MNSQDAANIETAIEEVLAPLERWAQQCHGASLAIVEAGIVEPARVARGGCKGVGGQHSWVVLGDNCYDDNAQIIDPTLWSYDESVEGIWIGSYRDSRHRPHGKGNIFNFGRPPRADELDEEPMELTPSKPWSAFARAFLRQLGPLSQTGWVRLAHFPVEGWPAAEIIEAMCDTPHPTIPGQTLQGQIPIDIVGMLTDRNPNGLYKKTSRPEAARPSLNPPEA